MFIINSHINVIFFQETTGRSRDVPLVYIYTSNYFQVCQFVFLSQEYYMIKNKIRNNYRLLVVHYFQYNRYMKSYKYY